MPIIVISYFVLASFTLLAAYNINRRYYQLLYLILGLGLVLLTGLRDGDSVRDYHTYVNMYNAIKSGAPVLTEISFKLIALFSSSSLILFIIYAILGVTAKCYAIKQIGSTLGLSILIYMSNFFILHEMTQIRAGVAAGILLLSVKYIYNRDRKRFIFCVVAACLFHISALIMIPLWFTNFKRRHLIILSALPIVSLCIAILKINTIAIIPIPFIQEKLEIYQKLTQKGLGEFNKINIFNLVFLAKVFIYYLLIFKYELVKSHNKYVPILMVIYCLSISSFWTFSTMPVISFRISELYAAVELVMIPLVAYIFKPRMIGVAAVVFIATICLLINIYYNSLVS